MKALIVEDDGMSRLLLEHILAPLCECHTAVNGKEALEAFREARERNTPYSLICLDIMMPEMDGHTTLKAIRELEQSQGVGWGQGVKVIMTTALDDHRNVFKAYGSFCDAYIYKPINREELIGHIASFGLV